jgi:copper chaperone CopZ
MRCKRDRPTISSALDDRARVETTRVVGSRARLRGLPNYAGDMGKGAVESEQSPELDPTGGPATVELHVDGMHCQSCVSVIEETLGRGPGVHRATVDLDAARASVTFDRATVSVADLCAAVTGAGYVATPLPPGDLSS